MPMPLASFSQHLENPAPLHKTEPCQLRPARCLVFEPQALSWKFKLWVGQVLPREVSFQRILLVPFSTSMSSFQRIHQQDSCLRLQAGQRCLFYHPLSRCSRKEQTPGKQPQPTSNSKLLAPHQGTVMQGLPLPTLGTSGK